MNSLIKYLGFVKRLFTGLTLQISSDWLPLLLKMKNTLNSDRWSHVLIPSGCFWGLGAWSWSAGQVGLTAFFALLGLVNAVFMLFFFRDPDRQSDAAAGLALAGADGTIRAIDHIDDETYVGEAALRISIYLSPMDVHINRAPIQGNIQELKYTPGKHLLTRDNAASEYNEHSSILIEGEQLSCRVHQIVGPLVRRVVYGREEGQGMERGEGMCLKKFGSELDMYFPASKVEALIQEGQQVTAGVTPVARCK